MESSLEWYQILAVYGGGIFLTVVWNKFTKEMKELLGLHPYTLAIILVVSGYIGLSLFSVEATSDENISIWSELWNLLITAPLDFIATLIVTVVFYCLFAIIPFTAIFTIIVFCKWLSNPDIFHEE